MLSLFLNWLIRGLTIVGGLAAVYFGWPISRAAWQAQRTDTVLYDMRLNYPVNARDVVAGADALDRAIAFDPAASRYFLRSELLGSAALIRTIALEPAQRTEFMRRARADLVSGLAASPAHGIDWLRLAVLQQQIAGPSRLVIAMMFTSIETGGRLPTGWQSRLRLILDCWPYLTDLEKARLKTHVEFIWRQTVVDRRLFGYVTHSAADHAILTWFLRDVPNAPQQLAKIIEKEAKP